MKKWRAQLSIYLHNCIACLIVIFLMYGYYLGIDMDYKSKAYCISPSCVYLFYFSKKIIHTVEFYIFLTSLTLIFANKENTFFLGKKKYWYC